MNGHMDRRMMDRHAAVWCKHVHVCEHITTLTNIPSEAYPVSPPNITSTYPTSSSLMISYALSSGEDIA